MMKAVFLTHTAAPSGAELATLRLVTALPGHLDTAVVYTADGPMVAKTRARAIETHLVANDTDSATLTIANAGLPRLAAGVVRLIRLGWTLGRVMRDLEASVVVAQSAKALVIGAAAAGRARIPLVWQVHDRISAEYFGRTLAPVIRVFGWLVARGYIANSRSTLGSLITWRRPAVVAYPGLEARPPDRREDQRPPSDTIVTVVGRLAPWKGQDLFLRALAEVRTRPRRVFLVGGALFGEEAFRAELEQLTTEYDLPVTFTGHVDDPDSYMYRSDVLVHCTLLAEPFGQVVVEGMRAGCAVIATRPGGPTEIVEPGIDGLLVDGGDRGQLTEALNTLIEDRALRVRLAAAARVRARRFDVAESARVVADFLAAVPRKRHGRA
ncbi:glycosyltransferase family 4 protein [Nocardia cyriacigeorgica]|uniref:Glycosyltransferase family 4 protein n=1 Tax=Nocardia cyriacigeorgica TaxID=135487 RepID=A0A5R8NMG8_9NOCA|nr:glycosyltransferase family 4 protein [Nocardia cyriacigeorgica]TLF76890.1 glycosyltransferase family 4 protein [Nocardia cyriacigeorgica]